MRRVASPRTFDVVGDFFAVEGGGACCGSGVEATP